MSGGGGIIIITGHNADGTIPVGSPVSVPVSVFKALWESIPTGSQTSLPQQQAYAAVDALVNSVT